MFGLVCGLDIDRIKYAVCSAMQQRSGTFTVLYCAVSYGLADMCILDAIFFPFIYYGLNDYCKTLLILVQILFCHYITFLLSFKRNYLDTPDSGEEMVVQSPVD